MVSSTKLGSAGSSLHVLSSGSRCPHCVCHSPVNATMRKMWDLHRRKQRPPKTMRKTTKVMKTVNKTYAEATLEKHQPFNQTDTLPTERRRRHAAYTEEQPMSEESDIHCQPKAFFVQGARYAVHRRAALIWEVRYAAQRGTALIHLMTRATTQFSLPVPIWTCSPSTWET